LNTVNQDRWSIQDALFQYQVKNWSDGYFSINEKGNICASAQKSFNEHIDLSDIIDEMKKRSIGFPCVIRFHDILRSQVKKLNELFSSTITQANFNGKYWGVYPIKVNQLREVVDEIVDIGSDYHYGLEAGSKAELMAALTFNTTNESLTILNGYKDKEYMKLSILGKKMGKNTVVVIEKLSEIYTLIEVVNQEQDCPMIGVRVKLSSKSGGKWAKSSGEKAKFGLTTSEVLELIDILNEKDLLHKLNLFHFHVGSQIPDIRSIKECINEGARIFCELKKLGAALTFFDVGGGVGLNYDGSRSNCNSSTNYTLEDYVADVVYILKDICDSTKTEHPHIVTETGRAISAYHSCVVTNVFGSIKNTKLQNIDTSIKPHEHRLVKFLKELATELNHSNYQDIYNDASLAKEDALSAFKLGVMDLKQKSLCERLFWNICSKIINMTKNEKFVPSQINKLRFEHADKYLCNFSVFQSTPDSWAISQILPIVPIRRLNEPPTNHVTLADITCDSDGAISNFLSPRGHKSTLLAHELNPNEDYLIGIFLTGAYQDIMGDMHNLFGRLNEVHVFSDKEDGFYIEEIIKGQTSADVLKIMQYNPQNMCDKIKKSLDKKVKTGDIKPKTAVAFTDFYEEIIHKYTYLN
jgi:arginine decarboxylase